MLSGRLGHLIRNRFRRVVSAHAIVFSVRRVLFRTLTITNFTFRNSVNRRLRLSHSPTFSFAFFASPTFLVGKRVNDQVTRLLDRELLAMGFASLVVNPSVNRQIKAKALSSKILISGLSAFSRIRVTFRTKAIGRRTNDLIWVVLSAFMRGVARRQAFAQATSAYCSYRRVRKRLRVGPFRVIFANAFRLSVVVPKAAVGKRFCLILSHRVPSNVTITANFRVIRVALVSRFPARTANLQASISGMVNHASGLFIVLRRGGHVAWYLRLPRRLSRRVNIAEVRPSAQLIRCVGEPSRTAPREDHRVSALTFSSKGEKERTIGHRVTRPRVRRRLRTIDSLHRRAFNGKYLILIGSGVVRGNFYFHSQGNGRFHGVLSPCLCVGNFKARAKPFTDQTGNLSAVAHGRRAMLCLVRILFRGFGGIVSTIRSTNAIPGRIFLLLHRVMVEAVSQRIVFLTLRCGLFRPFSRRVTFPTSCHSLRGERTFVQRSRVFVSARRLPRAFTDQTNTWQIVGARRRVNQFLRRRAVNLRFLKVFFCGHSFKYMSASSADVIPFGGYHFNEVDGATFRYLIVQCSRAICRRFSRQMKGRYIVHRCFASAMGNLVSERANMAFFLRSFRLFLSATPVQRSSENMCNGADPNKVARGFFRSVTRLVFLRLLPQRKESNFPSANVRRPGMFMCLHENSRHQAQIANIRLLFSNGNEKGAFSVITFQLTRAPRRLANVNQGTLRVTTLPLHVRHVGYR